MFILITVLIMIAALLLAFVVLIQKSKGGGLADAWASQSQVLGVQKTADFLERTTWVLAISMIVLCIISSAMIPSKNASDNMSSSGINVTANPQNNTQNQNTTTIPTQN